MMPRKHTLSTPSSASKIMTADTAPNTLLMWFRRDLRTDDNAALTQALDLALQCGSKLHAAFVFDTDILDALPSRTDRRVDFIWHSVQALSTSLAQHGVALHVLHGQATPCITTLAQRLGVHAVFANHDYEPAAVKRDAQVASALQALGCAWNTYKDHVVFEKDEIQTQSGHFFTVFTPYKNAWLKRLHANPFAVAAHPSQQALEHYGQTAEPLPLPPTLPPLTAMGFNTTDLLQWVQPAPAGAQALWANFSQRMPHYHTQRDYPAVKGVSYLSVHLRFGTLSIRTLARSAFEQATTLGCQGAQVWLNELIWRDFYVHILHHRPDVVSNAFKPAYQAIAWEEGPQAQALFTAWCQGQTGYPLVDAAMRQLNQTGYQHNRLRMITASFLCKDLGLDWRWGEQYFAAQLNDFDLSANNGGWQWAASTGCDAQPYFRIFNPVSQSKKFDAEGKFIRRYCPELAALSAEHIHAPWECPHAVREAAGVILDGNYPKPVVDHALARQKTLARYGVLKERKG